MKNEKKLSELIVELSEYEGEDRVVTSYDMKAIIDKMPPLVPIMSKLPLLDKYTGGFVPGELVAISGPRKAGKTLLAQTLTNNFERQDVMSLWFSYELPAREFINRFPGELPIFVMPQKLKANSLEWLRMRIIEALTKYGVKTVFIDHLHFLFDLARMKNTSLEIGQVVRTLKTICIELNIVIFLMCHMQKLNPFVEPSDDNIRDSSFVSQESDAGIMVWRDIHTENQSLVKLCYHRRTGVLEKKIRYVKVGGLLQEMAEEKTSTKTAQIRKDEFERIVNSYE